ncbi:MAG: beta-propeller fold lactonase family protein [Minisyncoccia bacterium]
MHIIIKNNIKKITHFRAFFSVVLMLSFILAPLSFYVKTAEAAPNYQMNYQGKLTNASNVAVADGTYNMRFWLLTSPSIATTSAIWTESLTSANKVQVTNGLFSIMLGSTSPLTGIDFNQTLYLGVEIGGTSTPTWDGEMSPRKILGSVPAAFEAKNASTVGGVASTSFLRKDQADTASSLLTFTGGILSNASSTITNLTTLIATTTTLVINGEAFTDFTGSGLTNSANILTCATSGSATFGCLTSSDWTLFNNKISSTSIDTSAELATLMTDETGTAGSLVFSTNPLLQGFRSNASSTIGDGTGVGGLTVSGNSTTTGNAYFAGNVGIGSSTPNARLTVSGGSFDLLALNSEGALGSELITAVADRDFSGANNWSGTNWSVGSGVVTHVAGNNTYSLGNGFLSSAPVAGNYYQVTFSINTTATGNPALSISFGGATATPLYGLKADGTQSSQIVVLQAINAGALTITPNNATWTGTIDNVSVKQITPSAIAQTIRNADGTAGVEIRAGGTGLNNTFVGKNSGLYNTTGTGNTAQGSAALYSNTSGYWNSAQGYLSLYNNTSGYQNAAQGHESLYSNTTGHGNAALGSSALRSNITGNSNTALGTAALYNNTSGSYNSAQGDTSLFSNTTGTQNTATGYASLYNNVSGSYNSVQGSLSLFTNTIGSYNTAQGYRALFSNTTGSSSVALGYLAGDNIATSWSNTLIGTESGYSSASASSSNNTLLGYRSGYGMGSVVGNLFLGYQAASSTTLGNYNILLGYNNNLASTTGSNQLNIGNLIYGTNLGVNGTLSSGNVGIGTTSPSAKLDVWGNLNIATGSTPTLFANTANGRVGIGTSSPSQNLTVAGNMHLTGALYDSVYNAGTSGMVLQTTGTGATWIATSSLGIAGVSGGTNGYLARFTGATTLSTGLLIDNGTVAGVNATTSTSTFNIRGTAGSSAALTVASSTGASLFNVLANGNVGVGTSTPIATLSVKGAAGFDLFTIASSTNQTLLTFTQAGNLLIGTTTASTTLGNIFQGTTTFVGTTALRVMGNIDNTFNGSFTPRIASTTNTDANPRSVFVSGNYAYTANYGAASMSIIDISNPTAPVTVSTIATGVQPQSVYVSGRYAYVANGLDATMSIFDVSNPVSPVLMSTTSTGVNPFAVHVSGRYAYVANRGNDTMSVYDISNPASPVLMSTSSTGSWPSSIHVVGRYAYIANYGGAKISVMDISNPSAPVTTSSTTVGTNPSAVYVQGRYAYVANQGSNSMSIVDISNPASLSVASTLSVGATPISVFVSGRYAYFANNTGSAMTIVDVASSTNPAVVSTVSSIGAGPFYVQVVGRYAYVVKSNDSNLSIIDLGGFETNTALVHSLEAGNAAVRNDLTVAGFLNVKTALSVGMGGFYSQGNSSVLGSFTAGTSSNPLFTVNAATNRVNIGTSTGAASLFIQGTTTQNLFTVASSTGSSLFTILANGKVGIGTSSPSQNLTVAGNMHLTGALYDSTYNAGTSGMVLQTTGTGVTWVATSSLGITGGSGVTGGTDGYLARFTGATTLSTGLLIDNGTVAGVNATTSTSTFNIRGTAGSSAALTVASSTGASLFNVLANGNVGIGTTSPTALLALMGSPLQTSPLFRVSSSSNQIFMEILADGSVDIGTGGVYYNASTNVTSIENLNLGALNFETDAGAVSWVDMLASSTPLNTVLSYTAQLDSSPVLTVYGESNGLGGVQNLRVGIGTTSPSATLAVVGAGTTDIFRLASSSGSTLLRVLAEGQMGIGTSSVSSMLTIQGTTTRNLLNIASSTGASLFSILANGNVGVGTTSPTSALFVQSASTTGSLLTVASTTGSSLFSILANGKVGIGTSSPSQNLTVAGNMHLTGALYDSTYNAGTSGMVLQTTGTGATWVATSSLGITGGSGVTGGVLGYATRWLSATTLGTSTLLDNGTVAGINATSSLYSFMVQGRAGTDPFAVASSTGQNMFAIDQLGRATFGTTTSSNIFLNGGASTTRVANSNSIAIGNEALFYTSTTSTTLHNIALGYQALYGSSTSRMTGVDNFAAGYQAGFSNTDGLGNSFIGYQAGYANTTGTGNSFTGYQVGMRNTTGNYNSFIGYQAGLFNTAGSGNSFTGYSAGLDNTTGSNNSFIGHQAGTSNTTGSNNSFTGYQAGFTNTTGFDNFAAGASAMYANTIGNNNIAIGTTSLRYNTTGSSNIALGMFALQGSSTAAMTGSNNIAFGNKSLASNVSGFGNIAMGSSSLQYSAAASNNIAFGTQALMGSSTVLMTGTDNFAAGFQAGLSNTTGLRNSFIGSSAGFSNTTGSYNSFTGYLAGYSNTTGSNNTFTGLQAGGSNTTGSHNFFTGYQAGFSNTTGSDNIAMGALSLNTNSTGISNIAFGTSSLRLTTGSNNLGLGAFAGNVNTTGNSNTYLGAFANASANNFASSTAIGAGAIVGASNALVLGGTGSSYVNVGIGTTTPDSTLTIRGTGVNNLVNIASSTGTSVFSILANGNVGIGSSTANARLTVSGGSFDLLALNTEGVEGAELITAVADRDFSGANNWSGTNWSVGSGVATHTAGNNTYSLGNGFLSSAPVAGNYYQITFDINTTAIGTPGVKVSFGGTDSTVEYGTNLDGAQTSQVVVVQAANTGALTITPNNATWTGTIDNVSVKQITPASIAQTIRNADGTVGVEIRAGGTGLDNTFVGKESGLYNTTGQGNSSQGVRALYSNTTGSNNSAHGSWTLRSNTTGFNNSAQGTWALYSNTTGSYNSAQGSDALFSNTTGSFNSAQGFDTLYFNTTGSFNSAQGMQALYSNTTGSANSAVGIDTLFNKTTGSSNVAFGYQSGYSLVNSNNNTLIGIQSGYSSASASSSDNTLLGYRSGYGMGNVVGNLFLGYQAASSTTLGNYNILLGYNNGLASTTGSNQLNIGNLIYGTNLGVNGSASTGNVGIGTSTPSSRLTIDKSGVSGAVVAGIKQYFGFINSVESAVYYGDETYIVNAPTATSTLVGKMIRIEDNSTLGNTVRGFESQAYRGTNTKGENTGLSGFGRTFGVRGTTIGDAGNTYLPAGVFAESQGTTQGNALRAYSGTITTENLVSLFHDTSVFSGTGLQMNFGNSGGSFAATSSAKFLDFKVGGTSRFTVTAGGTTTIGDGTTNNKAGLQIGYGGLCVDNDGSCNASTTGQITSVSSATGNSDLAEIYFGNEILHMGEIVSLSGGLSIERASETSAAAIIGVVSTKPGLLLGFDDTSLNLGEEGYPVGLKGRVPVKISTENGPIKKGDRITISSISGIGMKATESSRVVGIALEDFDGSRAYSAGFLNQFGDDMVRERITKKITIDPKTQDGCYNGGGAALGEEGCAPDKVKKTIVSITTDDSEYQEMLATLSDEEPQDAVTADGEATTIGQAIMFIDLAWYQSDAEKIVLSELTSTSSLLNGNGSETVWDRLKILAQGFVDGILSVLELKANRVEVRDELCVDGVCVTADDLRIILDQTRGASGGGGSTDTTDPGTGNGDTTPPVDEVPPAGDPEPGGTDPTTLVPPPETIPEEVTPPEEIIVEEPAPTPPPAEPVVAPVE